ncbi:MAG TPA: hypothetical protein VM285_11550 [Polyangia bacterium]|nr:hypothetical protein [Polyangia bacterium]
MSLSRDFVEFIACLNDRRVDYLLVAGREQDLLDVKKLTDAGQQPP